MSSLHTMCLKGVRRRTEHQKYFHHVFCLSGDPLIRMALFVYWHTDNANTYGCQIF